MKISSFDLLILLTLSLLPATSLRANPSDKDPHRPLDVHAGPAAEQLQKQAAELYASCIKDYEAFSQAEEQGRLGSINGNKIGQLRHNLVILERLSKQLQMLGEPSGADLQLRANELMAVELFTSKWPALPSSVRFMNSLRTKLNNQEAARRKAAEKLSRMIAKEQWEAAEKELYRILDSMWVGMHLMSSDDQRRYLHAFIDVQGPIDAAMYARRVAASKQLLEQSRQRQTPDFDGELQALGTAAQAIASTGQADWSGEMLGGPQILEKFAARWKEAHVAALRCRALDWALLTRAGAKINDANATVIESQYKTFTAGAIAGVADLIASDAQRVSAAEAASLHEQYLEVVAPLARQLADREAADGWQAALAELAAKSPDFAAEVQAYEAATGELLRWRARTANSQSAARFTMNQTLKPVMVAATQAERGYAGLYRGGSDASLSASVPKFLPIAAERLISAPVVALNVVRVSATSRGSIATYRDRVYANLPAGLDLGGHVAALEADLLVSPQAPPRTLAAAIAVTSARRGDLMTAGGQIAGTRVEGLITRFASLPPAASVFVPLGEMPDEDHARLSLRHVLMRFDIQPAWVQHEHFFHELPVTEQ